MSQGSGRAAKQPDTVRGKGSARQAGLLPERLLHKLWRSRSVRLLRTTDGRRLRVLYPGRPAPGHGPDFRDAVLDLDGAPLRGEVEVHRTKDDWRAHKHHQDRAYDSVVLHVVGVAPGPVPGPAPLPTVALDTAPIATDSSAPLDTFEEPLLSFLGSADKAGLRNLLQEAGLARYAERVERACAAVRHQGVEQALYEGILDALGYSENRTGFQLLGAVLPIALVRAVYRAASPERRMDRVHALLTIAAGLRPPDEHWTAVVGRPAMDRSAWKTAGVRPGNHPFRRLEGLAVLLDRHLAAGLTASLTQQVDEGAAGLVASLAVGDQGGSDTALIGRGRALEMVVNVALPVLDAWAGTQEDPELRTRCRRLYLAMPALQENTITREARRLAGGPYLPGLRLGACEQQGLMHLYRKAVAG